MTTSRIKSGAKSTSEQNEHVQKLKEDGAHMMLSPTASAANAIGDITRNINLNGEGVNGVDIQALADELQFQNQAMHQGDMSTLESMLLAQSHVLQTLFVEFSHKLSHAEYLEQVDTFSRIAFKAQNQCRQNLATLGELKNPKRATFIKQQNNAVNQQINQDGNQVENLENSEDSANELLEALPHEQLDTRAPQAPIGADKEMETVGEINRAKNT